MTSNLRLVPAPHDRTPSAEAYRARLAESRRLAEAARAKYERDTEAQRRRDQALAAVVGALCVVAAGVITWAVLS